MADSKISEFPAAITITAADVMPIVQAGFNKKILFGTICQNMAGSKLLSGYYCSASKNVITVGTVIPVDKSVVELNCNSATLTLPNGEVGQELFVYSANSSNIIIQPTLSLGFSQVSFNLAGKTVSLHYTSLGWVIRSSYGATVIV